MITKEEILAGGLAANFEALDKLRAEEQFNSEEFRLRLGCESKLIVQRMKKLRQERAGGSQEGAEK